MPDNSKDRRRVGADPTRNESGTGMTVTGGVSPYEKSRSAGFLSSGSGSTCMHRDHDFLLQLPTRKAQVGFTYAIALSKSGCRNDVRG